MHVNESKEVFFSFSYFYKSPPANDVLLPLNLDILSAQGIGRNISEDQLAAKQSGTLSLNST